jgi:hypothetical protein
MPTPIPIVVPAITTGVSHWASILPVGFPSWTDFWLAGLRYAQTTFTSLWPYMAVVAGLIFGITLITVIVKVWRGLAGQAQ